MFSAISTSSTAPSFKRESMNKSLADELDCFFEELDVNPIHALEMMERPNGGHEGIREDRRSEIKIAVPEERRKPSKTKIQYNSTAIANHDAVTSSGQENIDEQHAAQSNTVPSMRHKRSIFMEHLSPNKSPSQQLSHKDNTKLLTSKHNRNLIDRNANGFFKMETMASVTDVQRRTQQAEGIAALQRTLVPVAVSNAASSRTASSRASSSRAGAAVKHPSRSQKITFAEPRDRRRSKAQDSYSSTTCRTQNTPHFSLARDLIASGHSKKMLEPSAPARFVRLPTDPVVDFRRSFAGNGLRIIIPESELEKYKANDSGSIISVPDVDDAGQLKLKNDKPKLEFGTPRGFIADQCLESSCPIRWAHAKGPYHHKGLRSSNIMTGLFGHSNPPPEIWNAYRNMIRITRDGKTISLNERPRPKVDEDIVIAFAMFHYGELNSMSGEDFHKRYAGRHISSTTSLQSSSTNSSTRSGGSRLARRN